MRMPDNGQVPAVALAILTGSLTSPNYDHTALVPSIKLCRHQSMRSVAGKHMQRDKLCAAFPSRCHVLQRSALASRISPTKCAGDDLPFSMLCRQCATSQQGRHCIIEIVCGDKAVLVRTAILGGCCQTSASCHEHGQYERIGSGPY